jgi:hypothetical protein
LALEKSLGSGVDCSALAQGSLQVSEQPEAAGGSSVQHRWEEQCYWKLPKPEGTQHAETAAGSLQALLHAQLKLSRATLPIPWERCAILTIWAEDLWKAVILPSALQKREVHRLLELLLPEASTCFSA